MNLNEQLDLLLNKNNIYLDNNQQNLIIKYVNLISKWNRVYNLTSVKEPLDMLKKHIIDSLIINQYLSGNKIADIGTGAGLPGIPLAIANPDKQFMLLDSRCKRTTFLNQVKIELKLNNVNIINSRVENYKINTFDVIISRAFSSIEDFVKLTYHLCDKNSYFFALKGKNPSDELSFLENSPKIELKEIIKLNILDFNCERHLVILKKL
jgi:16S rRNA (guanine527-N7)-methyltransferase